MYMTIRQALITFPAIFTSSLVSNFRLVAFELNNGRLAMLAVAGIVAQELVTKSSVF